MKTAVSAYSYEGYIREGKMTQLSCVAKAAEMGFSAIEFTDMKAPTLDEQKKLAESIRKEAERVGIEVIAYTIGGCLYKGSREEDLAEIERLKNQLDVAKLLGAPLMRHDVCYTLTKTGRGRSFDLMLPTIAENARAVTEYAATLGIRTCTENHGYIAQDSDRVERLYYAVDHDNYGLLVDVGNFACADEDSARAVSRLAPYTVHVHVKDFHKIPFGQTVPEDIKSFPTRARNRLVGCAIGDGDIPVAQCLAILKSAGYDGFVSIEFEGSRPCLDELRLGLSRLKDMIAE